MSDFMTSQVCENCEYWDRVEDHIVGLCMSGKPRFKARHSTCPYWIPADPRNEEGKEGSV